MAKGLEKIIAESKNAILKNWFNAIIQTYDPATAKFMKNQKDPFANPVGSTNARGLEVLLDQLLEGMDLETITAHLDPIIRIRAVQNFTPAQATAFIFSLKSVVREFLDKEIREYRLARELLAFESKIDQLGLLAFDIYMGCREKIYQIKANEIRNRTFRVFERAGLISEKEE